LLNEKIPVEEKRENVKAIMENLFEKAVFFEEVIEED
jgi:hypothetical protein